VLGNLLELVQEQMRQSQMVMGFLLLLVMRLQKENLDQLPVLPGTRMLSPQLQVLADLQKASFHLVSTNRSQREAAMSPELHLRQITILQLVYSIQLHQADCLALVIARRPILLPQLQKEKK
jgi:hypothetical protein